MDGITNGLNTRFNVVLKSGSDKEFYLNLHQYVHFVETNEVIKAIIHKSQQEYAKAMGEIWEQYRQYTQEELDERSAKVYKLERFNLYALRAGIYVRVYLPTEDYKTTSEPDDHQDPAVVMLMRGYDYTLKLNRWSKDHLKGSLEWFEGRNVYEPELRRFHLALLDELIKPVPEIPLVKPELSFDTDKSIFKIGDKEINITIKNDKPIAHYVLEYMFENEDGLQAQSFYSEILNDKFPRERKSPKSIYDACNNINKKISEQANVSNFLIVKSGKSGYVQVNSDYL